MPRLYKCKPGSRVYKRTPDHILEKARVENAAGASQTDVCKKYLITRSVFQKYLKEHQSGECRRTPGGQTILSHETEKIIVDHLLHVSKWGFPFDTLDLRITVKRLLDKKGTKIPKFKDNVPGEDWAFSFMRRHKDRIKNRLCQNISTIDEEQSDQEAGPSTISMKNCGNEAQDTEFISDISTSESEEKNQSPKDKENQRTTRNIFSLFYP